MTPERWAAAQALFEAALELSDDERGAYVDRAAADADLASLVRGMLAADVVEQSESGLADVVSRAVEEVTAARSPQVERLGPYRIVSMLGEGGMGAVYLAERDDDEFLQQVAIKVVRGLLDPERVRQFRNERQILAWLEHANIARLLDGGTTDDGLPYLVMEYVAGVPIDRYADARRLTVADRLRLFLVVCDAVSHAHRSLIVHRDIKPTNILVTAAGVPKLLDFGIARLALEGGAPDRSVTRAPARMMTPDYASPEVVRGEHVTTAADVYALGVLLYELLTGRRPLRFATLSSLEIERVVCHVDPPRASDAAGLDSDPPGVSAATRAATRQTSAQRLRTELRGDLDAVLSTAMAKDPDRRYASVDAFAADLRSYLDGRPIAARRATWAYTARRFVARHRWPVAAAAAFVVVLSGAAIVLSIQAARLAEERDRTAHERDTAQQVVGFLTGLFEVSDPDASAGPPVSARELLDRGAERIDTELSGQPVVQARLLGTIGGVYGSLGVYDQSATLLERALDLRRSTLGVGHVDTAASMEALAEAYRELARYDDAEALHREALAIKRRVGDSPASIAASLNDLGLTLIERGRYADAEPLLREAIETWRRLEPDASANVAVGLNNLAQTLRQQGRLDDAAAALDEAIAIRRRRFGNDHPLLAHVLGHLGQVRNAQGDLARAEPLLREALAIRRKAYGDDHPDTATSFNNLASLLHDAGDLDPGRTVLPAGAGQQRAAARNQASRLRRAAEQPGLAARRSGPGRRGRTAVQDLPGGAPHRPRARSSGRGAGAAQPGPRRTGARPRRSRRDAGRLGARPAPAGPAGRPRRDRREPQPAGRGATPAAAPGGSRAVVERGAGPSAGRARQRPSAGGDDPARAVDALPRNGAAGARRGGRAPGSRHPQRQAARRSLAAGDDRPDARRSAVCHRPAGGRAAARGACPSRA